MKSLLFLLPLFLILTGCAYSDNANDQEPKEAAVGLLQHNVYFYMKEDITPEEMQAFEQGLQELMSIEEVYSWQIGIPGDTEERDVTDHSFGYSIFSWFESMEDYEVYAEHPTHLAFIDQYQELWVDVKVYDSEVILSSE